MNKKLTKLIDDFGVELTAPTEVNAKMKEGLARIFADEGIRGYLENAVRIANRNLIKCLDNGEDRQATYYANRIQTIILLLTTGKVWYSSMEKLKNLKSNALS